MERQSTYGCYHPEAAGLLPNDVHVIDLRTHSRLVKRSDSSDDSGAMPEVVVDLVPDLTGDDPLPRNLTLILKSDNPVRWQLKSHGIQGQLVVAAGKHLFLVKLLPHTSHFVFTYSSWPPCNIYLILIKRQ